MYLRACGFVLLTTVVFFIIAAKVVNTLAQFWLSYWAASDLEERGAGLMFATASPPIVRLYYKLQEVVAQRAFPPASEHPGPYILVYGAIELAEALVLTLMIVTTYVATLKASKTLFARMLDSVSHATARWIDKTPSGRILNRFARDIEVLDNSLLSNLATVAQYGINLIASVLILSVSLPPFILPAAMLSYLYVSCESQFSPRCIDLC